MMRCKPMLAYPVSDKPIDYSKPTFIQPKLDGELYNHDLRDNFERLYHWSEKQNQQTRIV